MSRDEIFKAKNFHEWLSNYKIKLMFVIEERAKAQIFSQKGQKSEKLTIHFCLS